MVKIFRWSAGLLAFALVVSSIPSVEAATLNFDNNNVTLALPNGHNIAITINSKAESIVVNDDSTLTVTLGSDSDITFQSADLWVFTVTPSIATNNCSNFVASINLVSTSAQTVTVTSSTDRCPTGGSGGSSGGGGGGGGVTPQPPTNLSAMINAGKAKTTSTAVTLALSATNATQMLIANNADFSDATSWKDYAMTASWDLTAGIGMKTVYVKFRSSSGAESAAVTDSIELIGAPAPTTSLINDIVGGTLELSDKSAGVTIPSGALQSPAQVKIVPTVDYTLPGGNNKIVGDFAYDFSAKIGEVNITQFTKPLTLTFTYTDAAINGLNESSLSVQYWDTATAKWISIGGTVDQTNNKITATTNHFTVFAVVGESTTPLPTSPSGAGTLVKLQCQTNASVNDPCKAVYYLATNGKRYVFPNEKTYKTWYADFSGVTTVTADQMSSYAIGGNVTYRPGVKLIKINTDPKVYAVAGGGTLRWLSAEAVALALYGANWAQQVEDVSDAFFVNYKTGADINAASDYSPATQQSSYQSIGSDKGL